MLDLKTRVRFVDHTSREDIVARCDRRKRDRTVIDLLAGRSNLHPCFRIRGNLVLEVVMVKKKSTAVWARMTDRAMTEWGTRWTER